MRPFATVLLLVMVVAGVTSCREQPGSGLQNQPAKSNSVVAARSSAQIVDDIGLIESVVPKRGEPQTDPYAAAIVALGREAGPFLVEKITDDRDSKWSDLFQWRICDIADELLGDIYHQSPSDALVKRKPPLDPTHGYYYRDYVELKSTEAGRKELQAAWRKIVEQK